MLVNRDVTAIYAGHDAGYYVLPSEALAARTAVLTLHEARRAATAARTELEDAARRARGAAARDLLSLANAGRDLPQDPGQPVIDANGESALANANQQAFCDALSAAERALKETLGAEADAIIVAALQPALAEVVAEVKLLAPALAGLDIDNAADIAHVMRRPTARAAYVRLIPASDRHDAIRAAQLALYRVAGGSGRVPVRAEVRNVGRVPIRRDLEGPARLLDLVVRGAELWVPTADELQRASRTRGLGERVEVPGGRLIGHRAVALVDGDSEVAVLVET